MPDIARWMQRGALVCTIVDVAALSAHVLELPNKLALSGPLWLAVQQNLYRGWGPVLGPFEVGAVVTTWLLALVVRRRAALVAAILLTATLVLFFAVVEPVNVAFAGWTPASLPDDWPRYRLRWELGHATRAALAATALRFLVSVRVRDR
jgi:hypothetical protein